MAESIFKQMGGVIANAIAPAVIKVLDTSTGQNAQTAHSINWETVAFNTDTNTFERPSNAQIKVLKDGFYRVTYNTRYTNTGANRFSTYARILVDGSANNETYTKAYSRGSGLGSELTNFCQVILELNAGSTVEVQVGKQQADQTDAVNRVANTGFFQVEKL